MPLPLPPPPHERQPPPVAAECVAFAVAADVGCVAAAGREWKGQRGPCPHVRRQGLIAVRPGACIGVAARVPVLADVALVPASVALARVLSPVLSPPSVAVAVAAVASVVPSAAAACAVADDPIAMRVTCEYIYNHVNISCRRRHARIIRRRAQTMEKRTHHHTWRQKEAIQPEATYFTWHRRA